MKKHGILKRFRKNNNIFILRPDKGDDTVIIDRNIYIQKIFEIIKDCTKLKEISTDPTTKRDISKGFQDLQKTRKVLLKKPMKKYILVALSQRLYMEHLKFTS